MFFSYFSAHVVGNYMKELYCIEANTNLQILTHKLLINDFDKLLKRSSIS